MYNHEILLCACGGAEHQIIFSFEDYLDDGYKEVYITYHLPPVPLFERLMNAFWYILGKRSRYGDFGCVVVDDSNYQLFQKVVEFFK